MAQNCKKRRDVVETQLNRPRGIQNNHFLGQNPKSLMTPPYYTALGHCALAREDAAEGRKFPSGLKTHTVAQGSTNL